eukprot:3274855-Rhodomonas_salina.1
MPSATAQTESVETEGVETERVETERGGHLVVHQLFQAPHVQDQPRPALQQTGAKRLVVNCPGKGGWASSLKESKPRLLRGLGVGCA